MIRTVIVGTLPAEKRDSEQLLRSSIESPKFSTNIAGCIAQRVSSRQKIFETDSLFPIGVEYLILQKKYRNLAKVDDRCSTARAFHKLDGDSAIP